VPIEASGASLWSRGALHELPRGLVLGVPTDLDAIVHFKGLSWRAHLHARRDVLMPRRLRVAGDITIGSILRRKLGDELCYQFIEPMIGGIQAGRVDELSATSVFPALVEAAKSGGSLMKALRQSTSLSPGPVSSRGENASTSNAPRSDLDTPIFFTLARGVGSLVELLEQALRDRGVDIRTNVEVTALRRTPAGDYPWEVDTRSTTTPANAVVMATSAPVVGTLLGAHDPRIERLGTLRSASAALVTFVASKNEVTLTDRGTGILVPLNTRWARGDSMMVTAVTLLDRKWPHLAREHDVLLRAHVGRSDDTRWTALSDDELTARVSAELATLLPRFSTTTSSLVQRWPDALPQYVLGHEALVRDARLACSPRGIFLAGNAYDGVGVPASIGSGRRAARDALEAIT
jgi:oxygen-dependent protoporphyrinogen oxidase